MKKVFITGAGRGLGFNSVKLLLDKGYYVYASDVNIDNLKKIKNGNLCSLIMDVSKTSSIEKVFKKINSETDELYAIINFAGITYMDSLVEADLEKLEQLLSINIMGTIRVNKIFFPLIEKNKGRIINISSETAYLTSPPFNGPYTMSKYALEAYNDSLRRELQMIGIKVINLQLGALKTDMYKDLISSFKALMKSTKYFKENLKNMEDMVNKDFEKAKDIKHINKPLLKSLEKENPKTCYKVKNNSLLQLVSLLPEKTIDNIYKNNIS